MNKKGPIVVVEDDEDDIEIIKDALLDLNVRNELMFFTDGHQAYEYLNDIKEPIAVPFFILSDINMPKMSGIQLRDKMQNEGNLTHRLAPFIFLTTAISDNMILNEYANSVQGIFTKGNDYSSVKNTVKKIVEYWQECQSPNFIKI